MTAQPAVLPTAGNHQAMASGHNRIVALAFAREGIAVLPCIASGPRSKRPLTEHGHHDATIDLETVRRW
jgi:Bifunctional DNA primase/polymerase, N-terminal